MIGVGISTALLSNTSMTGLSITPMRIAEVNGRIPDGTVNNAGMTHFIGRWPYIVGAKQKDIAFWFPNFYFNGSSGAPNTGNAYTIISASVEYLGVTKPIKFLSNRSKEIPNGAYNIYSDFLPASEFGLSFFPKGAVLYLKFIGSVPNAGNSIPWAGNGARSDLAIASAKGAFYNPANTTPSSVDATGVFTATGTAFTNKASILRPNMVGHPVSDGKSFIGFGDSLMEYQDDTQSELMAGRGYFVRALYKDGVDVYPGINVGKGSAEATLLINDTKWREVLSWARFAVGSFFTNDIQAGQSVLTMKSRFESVNTILRNGGIEQIHWISLLQRNTSTDNFLTQKNQTVLTDWGSGGKAEQMNLWYPTKVEDNTIDGYINFRPLVLNGYLWKTDGVTPNKYAEGVHYKSYSAVFLGEELRSKMDAM